VVTPASSISAQARRAPTRTRSGVRFISIGQIFWLNQSSIETSSAAPRIITIGLWV
jgi:hypothetical protein